MTRKSPRKYTEEFKQEAVRLVTERGYSQQEAADSLGIHSKNLNRWIRAQDTSKKIDASLEQKEIQALRKEIKKLTLEKEILKKAAAFFANESS